MVDNLFLTYIVEQACLAVLSLGVFVAFNRQLEAESRQGRPILSSSIIYKFHRVGWLASAIYVALCVDPYGGHGIYHDGITRILLANITALILGALLFLSEATTVVVYKSKLKSPPKWPMYLSYFILFASLVVGNVSYALAYKDDRRWYTGIFHMWSGIVVIIFTLSFTISTFSIINALNKAERTQRGFDSGLSEGASRMRSQSASDLERGRRKSHMQVRAVVVALVGLSVGPYQIYSGSKRVKDRNAPNFEADLDEFVLMDHMWLYIQWVCIFVMLWYSWYVFLPMCFCLLSFCWIGWISPTLLFLFPQPCRLYQYSFFILHPTCTLLGSL